MQKGFTLIELIIVIVILGILAVTAAPRFIDISDDAIKAVTEAEAAAFKSSINLIYSAYQIRQESPVEVGDQEISIDTVSEWPTGNGSNSALCVDLWNKVLSNAEPIVATTNPMSMQDEGWNAYGLTGFCAYGKSYSDLSFASGTLPHFVYYYRDISPQNYNGQIYQGKAGTIQLINM